MAEARHVTMDMLVCTGKEGVAIQQRMRSYEVGDPVMFYTARDLFGGRTLLSLCKVGGGSCFVCEVDTKDPGTMSGIVYGDVSRHHHRRADMERDMLLGARLAGPEDMQRIRAHLEA